MSGTGAIEHETLEAARQSEAERNVETLPARPHWQLSNLAKAWAKFWISGLMLFCVERCPRLLRWGKPHFIALTWRTSGFLRQSLLANARRILGHQAGSEAHAALAKSVLGNFYDCICELAHTSRCDCNTIQERIGDVIGREHYLAARSRQRGAILVTAHLGAFETAVAALRAEESRIHIVFRRDPMKRFERMRTRQRQRLGVIEAPVDDGIAVWVQLRDALQNNEVVLMQGDRVMPGQRGERLPFLSGHMLFPNGPVRLAMLTGAPILPIFAPRLPDGTVRIIIEEPIGAPLDRDGSQAMIQLSRAIERTVRAYPAQWLVLHRAFCEDEAQGSSGK